MSESAARGDLPLLATATTAIYLLVSYGYPYLTDRLPSSRGAPSDLRLAYSDGRGVLRELVAQCSEHGFAVSDLDVEHTERNGNGRRPAVTMRLELRGRGSVAQLARDLDGVDGVFAVHACDANEAPDL